ncbi:MAG: trypsin-like serine protease [Solirubrobacteraceae bacterium]|nr:trypsin-like serine protease [Patulibacter sp.]
MRPRIGRIALALAALLIAALSPTAALADSSSDSTSNSDPQGRVISGSTVSPTDVSATGRWSATVAVFATDGQGTRLCTGTLIATNWVATAGHCLAQTNNATAAIDPANVYIAANVNSVSNAGDHLVSAVNTYVNPGYSWTNASWDVALIELQTAVPTTPFALPDPNRSADSYAVGSADNVAGFGRSQATNSTSSGTLRSGRLEQVNSAACEQYNPGSGQYSDCYLPGGGRQATCFGDSGGPLVRFDTNGSPVLWGITSTGPDPCDAATGGAFAPSFETRVTTVVPWIRSIMTGSTYVPTTTTARTSTTTTTGSGSVATGVVGAGLKTVKAPAGGTGIGIFQAKLNTAPSLKKTGVITLSSSFIGSTGTGSAQIVRCVKTKCRTVSTTSVLYPTAGITVATKIKVARCVKHGTLTVKLAVTDSNGVARDSASERIAKCK